MKYFTKEWYEVCGDTGYHLNMQVSKNAESLSEEYYHDLYLRRRRAYMKLQKEVAEINGTVFDKAAEEAEFQKFHEMAVKRYQERLPQEILKQVADVRVLALDIATKEVKQQLKDWCEKNEQQMHTGLDKYWKEVCPAQKDAVGEEIQQEFSFHDSKITGMEMGADTLTFKMEPVFSDVKKVIFKNYKILEQDGYMIGAEWLYQEVYAVEGGNEYHGLLWKKDGKLGYLTIFAEEIAFVR